MAGLRKQHSLKMVDKDDDIEIRLELWYAQYLSSVTDAINTTAGKNSFKAALRKGIAVLRIFGVEGDIEVIVTRVYVRVALLC